MNKDYDITGFPSACVEYHEKSLSLDDYLQTSNPALVIVTLQVDQPSLGFIKGDRLVIDKSLMPKHGSIVVTDNHGEQGLFKVIKDNGIIRLQSSQSLIGGDVSEMVSGVVVAMFREFI